MRCRWSISRISSKKYKVCNQEWRNVFIWCCTKMCFLSGIGLQKSLWATDNTRHCIGVRIFVNWPMITLFHYCSCTPGGRGGDIATITWYLRNRPLPPQPYRVAQKCGTNFLYALNLPNINRFSKLFHYQNQEKICNNTISKDPSTPQVCRYTTLWNISVLKATMENKTTSVTTHCKKLTTGNNVFIVSVNV